MVLRGRRTGALRNTKPLSEDKEKKEKEGGKSFSGRDAGSHLNQKR